MKVDDEERQATRDLIGGLNLALRNVRAERDELRAEVRRLSAKLDAVPVDAIKTVHWGDSTSTGFVEACGVVGDWLVSVSEQTQAVQP